MKRHTTNAVNKVFPNVTVQRKSIAGENKNFYLGLAKKAIFCNPVRKPASTTDLNDLPEVLRLKNCIEQLQQEKLSIDGLLEAELKSNVQDKDSLLLLFTRHNKVVNKCKEYQDVLEKLYESEIQRLSKFSDSLIVPQSEQLCKEIDVFTKILDFDLEKIEEDIDCTKLHFKLRDLPKDVKDGCPLIYNIVEALLLTKNDQSVQNEVRVRSAVHAIALLLSLRNQKIQNNFKLMFTILCVSYGAGQRFVGMLNHVGLCISWQKFVDFLDKRLKQKEVLIKRRVQDLKPIILLMDNINMYRGKKKHIRLLRNVSPTMWNFTGRGLYLPKLADTYFTDRDKCLSSQKNPLNLTASEIFIECDSDKINTWKAAVDKYLIGILDTGLNKIPSTTGFSDMKNMTEKEVQNWLQKSSSKTPTKKNFKIKIPAEVVSDKIGPNESDIDQLPLSLDDNGTIAGTVNILSDFAQLFNLPNSELLKESCPFDTRLHKFDIKLARSHFELRTTLLNHAKYMTELEEQLRSSDKSIVQDIEAEPGDMAEEINQLKKKPATIENEEKRYRLEDREFWESYNALFSELSETIGSGIQDHYFKLVSSAKKKICKLTDHLGRTLLHVAVEMENVSYVHFLLEAGSCINAKEGCGLTPLNLAVAKKNKDMCQILVNAGAKFAGPLFTSITSPLKMAEILAYADILAIFNSDRALSEDEDDIIRDCDVTFLKAPPLKPEADNETFTNSGRSTNGYVTLVVGDVGTCKNNCAAMSRSSKFNWVGIVPGDLHNKGYFCESVFKAHSSSGFHYILMNVLRRKRLSTEVFKERKFNDDNLTKIREAVKDVAMAYGIAAAIEFKNSPLFPTQSDLSRDMRENKSHTGVLLVRFRKWLDICSKEDKAFAHRASLFTFYGPLLEFYDAVTAVGDGYAREIVYQLVTPLYSQLSFPNYYTECFRHVINFIAKWPEVTR
eukprot:Seg1598.4 transcript_id=Seg1598.4/GoldUCD/mRNA.D3Y31 product="Potassium channel AKT3" protein_id=Seg1598.4/GoldUCD/D3Y31